MFLICLLSYNTALHIVYMYIISLAWPRAGIFHSILSINQTFLSPVHLHVFVTHTHIHIHTLSLLPAVKWLTPTTSALPFALSCVFASGHDIGSIFYPPSFWTYRRTISLPYRWWWMQCDMIWQEGRCQWWLNERSTRRGNRGRNTRTSDRGRNAGRSNGGRNARRSNGGRSDGGILRGTRGWDIKW